MAIAFTKTGQPEEAIRHYKRALELDDTLGGAHYGVAFLLLKRGDVAAGGRPPARVPGAAAQGPRRRALGPPRRDRAARDRRAARRRRRREALARLLSLAAWWRHAAGSTKVRAAWWRSKSRSPALDPRGRRDRSSSSPGALDKDGDSVDAPVTWQSADRRRRRWTATGVVTGVSARAPRGCRRSSGSLSSELVHLRRSSAPADTLILAGDSVFTLPVGVEPPPTATLTVAAADLHPAGPARWPAGDLRRSPARLRRRDAGGPARRRRRDDTVTTGGRTARPAP